MSKKHEKAPAGKGLSIIVYKQEQFEKSLRKFKKMVLSSGLLTEVRDRQAYVSKGERRRLKKEAARRRAQKQQRENQLI